MKKADQGEGKQRQGVLKESSTMYFLSAKY